MSSILEELIAKNNERVRESGRAEGLIIGERKNLLENIRTLMERLNWSAETAMDNLGISPEKQKRLVPLIEKEINRHELREKLVAEFMAKGHSEIWAKAYAKAYDEKLNDLCSPAYSDLYAEGYADSYVKSYKARIVAETLAVMKTMKLSAKETLDALEVPSEIQKELMPIITEKFFGGNNMRIIHTENAPAAVGPYSQAIKVNGLLYTSGQIAIDPAVGKIVAKDIEGQAEQCCKNLAAVLEAAGYDFSEVFKTTCFLADIADFKAFNAVYEKYFISKPARSCVAVKDLPAGALCEIELIAAK